MGAGEGQLRDLTQGFRDACLAEDRHPRTSVKLRPRQLNFGTTYAAALDGLGDDFWDVGHQGIAGDSAQIANLSICRASNWAACEGSDLYYFCTATPTGALSSFETAGATANWGLADKCRPGLCADSTTWYLFFCATDNGTIKRRQSTNGTSWTDETTLGTISGWDSLAIAPISALEFFACYLKGVRLYVEHWWSGGGPWSHKTFCVGIDDYDWSDAHYFDAESYPGDANRRVLVHAQAPKVACSRIWHSGTMGEPYSVLLSDQEYSFQHTRVSSLHTEGGVLWAHCRKGILSSDDMVYTPYGVVLRSVDGKNWAPMASTGVLECRGKIYAQGSRVVVISPATAISADATSLLGTPTEVDLSDYATQWSFRFGEDKCGEGTTTVHDPLDVSLLQPGVELRRYYTVGSEDDALISTETLDTPARRLTNSENTYEVISRGPIKALDTAPLADSLFSSGYSRFHLFDLMRVAAYSGTWDIWEPTWSANKYLRCTGTEDEEENAICSLAIAPGGLSGDFTIKAHVRYMTVLSPAYLVFWYEDTDNFWRFGYTGTAFEFQRIEDGVVTTLSTYTRAVNTDVSLHFMVILRGDKLNGYLCEGSTWWWMTEYVFAQTDAPPRGAAGLSAEGEVGQRVIFHHLHVREHGHDWTRGKIVQSIAATCGVDLDMDDVCTCVGMDDSQWIEAGGEFKMLNVLGRELDIEAVIDRGAGQCDIVIGSTSNDNYINISGWGIRFGVDKISLLRISEGDIAEKQRRPYTVPGVANARVVVRRGLLGGTYFTVWMNGEFAAEFYIGLVGDTVNRHYGNDVEEGYVGVHLYNSDVQTFTVRSFADYRDSFVWMRGQPGKAAIAEQLKGSFLRLVEQADHTLKLQETGNDLGTYRHMLVSYAGNESDREWASVFRVTGAEVYVEYAHSPLLMTRGERAMDVDAPDLWSERDCLDHAVQMGIYMETLLDGRGATGHLDPALLPGDLFAIHSDVDAYSGIVTSGRFSVKDGYGGMEITARAQPVSRDAMTWDTDGWDEAIWG